MVIRLLCVNMPQGCADITGQLVNFMMMTYNGRMTVFSCYNRNLNNSNGGELLLGGTDTSHYDGTLNVINLTKETYWQVKMDG